MLALLCDLRVLCAFSVPQSPHLENGGNNFSTYVRGL